MFEIGVIKRSSDGIEHVAVIDHLYAIHPPFQRRTAMPNDGSMVSRPAPSKQHRPYLKAGRLGKMIATKKALSLHPIIILRTAYTPAQRPG